MANGTVGYGFKPVDIHGGNYTGRVNMYYHASTDATALYVGDPVVLSGSASTDGYPTVIRATVGTAVTSDYITGIVVGFVPYEAIPTYKYGPASTAYYLLVADDPNQIFRVKSDGTTVVGDVGGFTQIVSGSGNTYTGLSGYKLDQSEVSTTATDQLRIVGIPNDPDNEVGADGDMLVKINMHSYTPGTAGVGV